MSAKLKISEIFHSIQGESTLAGCPCAFVRLAGCNLHCTWCDTRYAADSEGQEKEIADIVSTLLSYDTNLACITGGEPLIQNNTPLLAQRLLAEDMTVQVETNGSQDISSLPREARCVMDVKCPDSGAQGTTHKQNYRELTPEDEVKFVIASRRDFQWALDTVREESLIERCPVLFSPVTRTNQESTEPIKASTLAEWILAARRPIRLQMQLHRIIWPDRAKGV